MSRQSLAKVDGKVIIPDKEGLRNKTEGVAVYRLVDPKDLMPLLQAIMKDDQEDIRIRMAFLAKKYELVGDSKAAA